jgi:transcriptional regulator with XRE-family HTH domain
MESSLGDRMRWVRERALGLTIAELATEMARSGSHVSANSISRYEREVRIPDVEYVRVLSEMSGVSTDWILKGENPRGAQGELSYVIQRLERLTEELREAERQGAAPQAERGGSAIREVPFHRLEQVGNDAPIKPR